VVTLNVVAQKPGQQRGHQRREGHPLTFLIFEIDIFIFFGSTPINSVVQSRMRGKSLLVFDTHGSAEGFIILGRTQFEAPTKKDII
jgi:hypothetical protein